MSSVRPPNELRRHQAIAVRIAARIAIFGGNEPLPIEVTSAFVLGREVVSAGAQLLTGGVGDCQNTIKERAICGAQQARLNDGPTPTWIGVENSTVAQLPRRGSGGGLIVSPGIGHRRNFIEACLCNAAIAIYGKHGTASEVLFSLYLGRPVAFVGARWAHDKDPKTLVSRLKSDAMQQIPPQTLDPTTAVGQQIANAYMWQPEPNWRPDYVDLPADDNGEKAGAARNIIERLRLKIVHEAPPV